VKEKFAYGNTIVGRVVNAGKQEGLLVYSQDIFLHIKVISIRAAEIND